MPSPKPLALELRWYWGDLLLDTRHHLAQDGPVRSASAPKWEWTVLGVAMGQVSGRWRNLLRFAPPFLSDIEMVCDNARFLDGDDHTLFTWDGDVVEAHLLSEWVPQLQHRGTVLSDEAAQQGGHLRMEDGERHIRLTEEEHLTLQNGAIRMEARLTTAPRRIVPRAGDEVDYPFVGSMSVAGFAAGLTALLLWTAPMPVQTHATTARERIEAHIVQLQLPPEPEPIVEVKPEAAPASGEASREDEGRRGKRDSVQEDARSGRALAQQDRETVLNAGVLAAWSAAGMASLGESGISSDLADSIGLVGSAKGVARGTGLGRWGGGPGGGGTAEHLGGWGPRGDGPGGNPFGDGNGTCEGCPSGGDGKAEGVISVPSSAIQVIGIDRSLIQEVVQRNMALIRYCYQRELQRTPGLSGKVVVKFAISADGSVSSAATKESTMNNTSVESCINERFMRMQFPHIGSLALVSYPFLFSSD